MSRIVPQGKLSWTSSSSKDVTGYNVYYAADEDPTYDSPNVGVGNTNTVNLPLLGQEPAEGEIHYGVTAYDEVGNESDIVSIAVEIDTTPPGPPTNVKHDS